MIGESRTKPMEILLVEDGWTDARVTIYALRRSQVHHRLTLVRSVGEALQFLNREGIFARAPHTDLLLLDMMLPDGSGIDVLQAVSKMQPADRPTTVVLTASHDQTMRDRCEAFGVRDFLIKPVSDAAFLQLVRDHKKLMVHSTPTISRDNP